MRKRILSMVLATFMVASLLVGCGGGAGSGARAVALVWRDPKAPEKASGRGEDNAQLYMKVEDEDEDVNSWHLRERKHPPHRCRVLFYHQLD